MRSSAAGTYLRNDERVLLLLPQSRDAESISLVLEKVGVVSVLCVTPEEICSEISKGAGALLVTEELLSLRSKECLVSALDAQLPWSELPVIVLLRPGPETRAGRDALLLPGDVTLVERPVRVNTLVAIIRSALRSRRRQCLVRDYLRALDESETRYRTLFDSIDEGFCVIETIFDQNNEPVDYRFLETSPSFEKQTGLVDVVGKRMRELAPKHEEYWFNIFGRVTLTGEPVRIQRLAKHLNRWLDVYAFRFGPPENKQVAILLNDITERKQTESILSKAKDELEVRVRERTEDLTRALQKLRVETEERLQGAEELRRKDQLLMQQGRMAAMGEMVGNIAHQWRQPLNTLGLIVQELPVFFKLGKLDQQYLDESVKKAMQTISNMSHTIDDFRDFLKPDKARVLFRASEAVERAVSLVEASFKVMGLRIRTVVDEEVSIDGSPNEYAQVILNILVNAKDALIEQKTERPMIVLRLFNECGKAVLTVTDNAGGIPDAIIDKIFDPYFTTKGPNKGTGIGLFMSKSIVEKSMGGKLTVRNTWVQGERGAEFKIEV